MKKEVIGFLHSHWDREWYREYEVFRMRLLRVFDNVFDLLSKNKIPCFYFDGQISALEDYLEIRPENRDLIVSFIRRKKLFVGPFYCLTDEFLTDRSCVEKNLELGMKTAINMGCTDFIGYLADTFGHSKNMPEILREFGVDKCIVWRGCSDFPAEFSWMGTDTVNLVRGYFQDVFAQNIPIEKKAEILKRELDLISEKSGNCLLLPIGADHLGVPCDIQAQIKSVNEILKDSYEITLGSPFDYFSKVQDNFKNFEWNDELRDNSKTFTLQGCYSSRLDLKKFNVECSYMLDLASRFVKNQNAEEQYEKLLEYAYKMLLRNQAHDSICGCSTDDVHRENIIRYKKILQIANTILDELKFKNNFNEIRLVNLSDKDFSGVIEFESTKNIQGYDKINSRKGFDSYLLTDTYRIPVTEDYTTIYKYAVEVENAKPNDVEYIMKSLNESDLKVTKTSLKNSKIKLEIIDNEVFINDTKMSLIDFIDLGDSYNNGPDAGDKGNIYTVKRSKIALDTKTRASLRIDFGSKYDFIPVTISLDTNSDYLKFEANWTNSRKNHLLEIKFDLKTNIHEVFSEDMNTLIKRCFDSEYNIRENLPKTRGLEAKNNTAPMQRGFLVDEAENNLGVITKGLTQYEVYKNSIMIPILRATGVISNPKNPARTTPAGPPIETNDLQMLGENSAEFYVFFGNENAFNKVLDSVYNYIVA